jgi:2-oxo-4-hydroxy-4-carboxy-5-ureidoimidazoline decarboxylase
MCPSTHSTGSKEAEATRRLLTCLNVHRWAAEVAAGVPCPDYDALAAQAEASAAQLNDELFTALDGHPRIGQPRSAAPWCWARPHRWSCCWSAAGQ